MKYLLLIYTDEAAAVAAQADLTPDERAVWTKSWFDYGDWLTEKGWMVSGDPLQPTATATSVRAPDGKPVVTDGPFAETKEQLAGFYLLEAADLNEAIQLATKIPPARVGTIEVRPVRQLAA